MRVSSADLHLEDIKTFFLTSLLLIFYGIIIFMLIVGFVFRLCFYITCSFGG